jgi:putative methionine-R-sulfoxide reductase with GAF domain
MTSASRIELALSEQGKFRNAGEDFLRLRGYRRVLAEPRSRLSSVNNARKIDTFGGKLLPDLNAPHVLRGIRCRGTRIPSLRQLELRVGSELALEYANFPLAAGCALQPINAGGIRIVSEEKSKPILDEPTLERVLEAAYVLQERNRELRAKNLESVTPTTGDQRPAEERSTPRSGVPQAQDVPPTSKANPTFTLGQIVEIQHRIQVRHLGLEEAMSLIAERLTQIARASSAAIGILDSTKLIYRAAAGIMALPAGTEVLLENALGIACFRTGQVFRCADVSYELLLDRDECRRRGIQSMIAVPVFHDGGVAGGLELYFPNPQAFTEEDVHTCQLMAGLVTEALARNDEVSWKKSLATERAVMLEALEKLKPNLAALAETPAAREVATKSGASALPGSVSTLVCRKCRHELVGQEQFCGNCGSPRSGDYDPPDMQHKIASLWHMQEGMKKKTSAHPANGAPIYEQSKANLDQVDDPVYDQIDDPVDAGESVADASADSSEDQPLELFTAAEPYALTQPLRDEMTDSTEMLEAHSSEDFEDAASTDLETPMRTIPEADVEAPPPTALAKSQRSVTWSSAATTLDFFEQLAGATYSGAWAEFWNARRGDIYLAIAVVLVLGVIGWGIWSNHSVGSTGSPTVSSAHHRTAPDADLSLFDRILVKLGLAEAPDPPVYKGNPRTQVWVDLHTALYYCPGTDLYGKTPKGRFSSQREAQLDQYEPAYRKACD